MLTEQEFNSETEKMLRHLAIVMLATSGLGYGLLVLFSQ